MGFPIPHSVIYPLLLSVDALTPNVNPLIRPGWYLKVLLDWSKAYIGWVLKYPGLISPAVGYFV